MRQTNKITQRHFAEVITKKQLIIGIVFVPMYCFGWITFFYTRPMMTIINCFFDLQQEQRQQQVAFILISLLYVGVILAFAGFFKQAIHEFKRRWIHNMLWILFGFAGIFVLSNVFMSILMSIIHPVSTSVNELKMRGLLSDYPLMLAVLIVFIGPIIEELVYRVVVFRTIYRKHRILAYLVSSFLFGLQHVYEAVVLQNNHAEMWNILPYMVSGLLFCYLYDKKKNILVPLGTHVISNLLGVTLILLT